MSRQIGNAGHISPDAVDFGLVQGNGMPAGDTIPGHGPGMPARELALMLEEVLHLDIPENVYLVYGSGPLAAEICRSLALRKEDCARARCHESRGGRPEDVPKCGKKIYIIDESGESARRLAERLNADVCLCFFGFGTGEPGAESALEDAGVVIHASDSFGIPGVELRTSANFKSNG